MKAGTDYFGADAAGIKTRATPGLLIELVEHPSRAPSAGRPAPKQERPEK